MKRFVNAAVALAATLVAYQLYVLAVVPVVEPAIALRAFDPVNDADLKTSYLAVERYQRMLAAYLPPDHWALRGTPQVYEYGPMVLVIEDFKPISGGRIEINRSVLAAFPTPLVPGQTPPRDAIIAEAPHPSRIQFDNPDGLSFTSTQIGRPIAGEFSGEVTIYSDMKEAGPADDLRIVTSDVRFNQAMITTGAVVDLRLGPHRARGKVLEVRLLTEPHAGASGSSMPITGIDSLEIREQVQAQISTSGLDGFQDLRGGGGLPTAQAPGPVEGSGPLELTCLGPFRFDFTRFIASLQDDVRATLRNPGAADDQLYCRELRLHLGERDGSVAEIDTADEPEIARRQGRLLSGMTPRLIEAVGAPVRFDSPSRQASVRGRRLRAWIADRRVRIEGSPALLAHGLSEASAPVLEYTSPPADSPRVVGDLLAAGPGWLKLTPSPDQPERSFEARWNEIPRGEPAVVLRRDDRGQPVLSIVGRPEFAGAGLGKLRADRVVANLSEVAADGPDGPAIELAAGNGQQGAVLVNRVDAMGAVEFVGNEVEGYADDLVALMRPLPPGAGAAPTDAVNGPSFGPSAGPAPDPANPQQQVSVSQRYRLRTKSIQLDIGLAGSRATPVALVCSGGVKLEELPRADGQQALQIAGQQLRVDRLDRPGGARLTLAGAGDTPPVAGAEHHGLAEIRSQGMSVWVRDLHVDQAASQAWTEGQGDARLLLPAQGGATPLAGEATLRWRGGMRFDGSRLVLNDDVFAETTGGWLNCTQMTATLSQPIDLRTGAHAGGAAVDVAQVDCTGGVTIDYRGTDDAGQTSHERARMNTLAINRLTGVISGRGPGSLRSVRLAGAGVSPLGGPSIGGPSIGNSSKGGLRFLRVDFRDGLAGNFLERRAQFSGGVQVVYGPVLAWDHQLPLHSPEGVPPDSVELRSEELRVHEDPAASVRRGSATGAPLGPVELVAMRSVRIDAAMGAEGGGVIAEAARASYSQSADRFILEGDGGQQLAKLWARQNGQQEYAPATAQRLTHYISLGRTTIDDLRGAEYQAPPTSATRPSTAPR